MVFMHLVGQWYSRWFMTPAPNAAERVRRELSRLRVQMGITRSLGGSGVQDFLKDIHREDLSALFPARSRSLKRQIDGFVQILDTLALEQQKVCWIEKSPIHVAYIDIIERYIQPVQFIHIVRNGPDVVASLIDASRKYPDSFWADQYGSIDTCIALWKRAVTLTQENLHKPNHILVTYERLVEDTPAVLKDLCAFLGREFDPGMLEGYSSAAERVILGKEGWKASTFNSIRNFNTKFYEVFDAREQQYILDQLEDVHLEESKPPAIEAVAPAR
jgi:hypothetical protein